ncbi:MAG: DUF1631 domain-containing protein [Thiobacillus sp.]|nr:DUF1631 domain-containing protein [Thiobacillus sp.]
MNTPSVPQTSEALIREIDARMAQALGNFFQRSRAPIIDGILRAIGSELTPSMLTSGQTCIDWLNAYPDRLSTAFADQFRLNLARRNGLQSPAASESAELRLVDDALLERQLAIDRLGLHLSEELRSELILLFGRLDRLCDPNNQTSAAAYGPGAIVHALSKALDNLAFTVSSGTLLLINTLLPLQDTLRQTYNALNHYLAAEGIQEQVKDWPKPAPIARTRSRSSLGSDILARIQSASSGVGSPTNAGMTGTGLPGAAMPAGAAGVPPASFLASLNDWQANVSRMAEIAPGTPTLVLRQLQAHARETDAGHFDLAMLDAVAGLFEFILDDPNVSAAYKSEIAQLQIPTLRVALASPAFFSEDDHPARLVIDLLGQFSRRFPESHPSHALALQQVEAACTHIIDQPEHQLEAFVEAHAGLTTWLAAENARADSAVAADVARLEQIERQELGTLLALENLQDLTVRYPAPESVLRRLESAWVPHMASLYVAEAGEGPEWRAACLTLLQLFLSLQAPEDDTARETRLQAIPRINAELRKGLLAQGAEPGQLRDFFGAITATQECWIRPALGQQEDAISRFVPSRVSEAELESLARRMAGTPASDPADQQIQELLEGDWVDFDPPHEGLTTARVAWVGVHGYMLFCDSEGETRFSLDSEQLAAEIRAGRASIPEQSLTRKAMLRLHSQLAATPA